MPKQIYRTVKFNVVVTLFLFTIFVGAIFYNRVEKLDLVDSFYFSVITLTTVGYGDIAPETTAGKIFTIFYILIGIGIIMAFIDIFSEHMVERRTQARTEKIAKKENSNNK